MDYAINASSIKSKTSIKLVLTPTNTLEREFFNQLFANGSAIIEAIPNTEDIVITRKEENGKPSTTVKVDET